MNAPSEERAGSQHDHGNCELCDELEQRLRALEVERDARPREDSTMSTLRPSPDDAARAEELFTIYEAAWPEPVLRREWKTISQTERVMWIAVARSIDTFAAQAAQRAVDRETLAPLLATYECDEPHADEARPYYPQITWADIERDLSHPHDGDCVKQPQPCVRCHAERWVHKAEWIIDAIRARHAATGRGAE